ncbi:hypothetical protein [Terasakiella sp. SH-1]|uniref:hypothetical protein n=1 Tax=Terasakiella sp. SH-1 TaxID=2560057 RepID=UPI0010737D5B|nr:hypothetical protein [Terasakiella sp. SH-1]
MFICRAIFAFLLVIFAASCTYQGASDNPVARKFTWFSYINGDDIRKACASLGGDRYRFVYNGIYQYQTRTYDVFGLSKKLSMQVRGPSNLKKLDIQDFFAPWRGVSEQLQVSDKVLAHLKKALIESAALQPPPQGLRLYSDQFYWTVIACVEGDIYFNAYKWPSQRWDQILFDDVLLSLDVTGVPFEEPRVLSTLDIWGSLSDANPFLIQVGQNGLVGFE